MPRLALKFEEWPLDYFVAAAVVVCIGDASWVVDDDRTSLHLSLHLSGAFLIFLSGTGAGQNRQRRHAIETRWAR